MSNKRTSSPRRKEARAASWARCQRRKQARREDQADREALNRTRRAEGTPTPWEAARAARKARRAAERKAA